MKRYEKIKQMSLDEMEEFFRGKLDISDEICEECRYKVNGECPIDTGKADECMMPAMAEVREWLTAEVKDN